MNAGTLNWLTYTLPDESMATFLVQVKYIIAVLLLPPVALFSISFIPKTHQEMKSSISECTWHVSGYKLGHVQYIHPGVEGNNIEENNTNMY